MGLLLSEHGVGPTEEKVTAVRETEPPTSVAEVWSFLGLISFSSSFSPDFATTAEPLRKLKTTRYQVAVGQRGKQLNYHTADMKEHLVTTCG